MCLLYKDPGGAGGPLGISAPLISISPPSRHSKSGTPVPPSPDVAGAEYEKGADWRGPSQALSPPPKLVETTGRPADAQEGRAVEAWADAQPFGLGDDSVVATPLKFP